MGRSRNDHGRCEACWVQREHCFCAALVPGPVAVRLALVRHYKEQWKTSNTARIVAATCEGSTVHDWHGRGAPYDGPELGPESYLLYPDADMGPADVPDGATVVVVDGAWKQVGKMVRFAPGLARLPRVSVPVTEAASPLLRRRVRTGGVSSAEAIAVLLTARGDLAAADRLRAGLRAQAEAILASKGLSETVRNDQLRTSTRGEGVATPSDGG